MSQASRSFFVGIHKKDGQYVGHTVSTTPPETGGSTDLPKGDTSSESPKPAAEVDQTLTFKEVFQSFTSIMESYRKFIPLTLGIAPLMSFVMAEKTISEFAKSRGTQRNDISNETMEVYELNLSCYRQLKQKCDETDALLDGARHLPEVMAIGLVSVYDAFLSQLLRVVFNLHPEIILMSEKAIKFSDLAKFSSIDEARASLIDREIEAILRLSHHEQFAAIEKLFSIPLRDNLNVWPIFIELCERRNLLTHTGGMSCRLNRINLNNSF